MKNNYLKSLLFIMCIFVISGCVKKTDTKTSDKNEIKYIAYYFHPTARCEACLNLENYIKELIETKFSNKGFVYKSLNIEQKENEPYRKDFNLLFSSVIIENSMNKKWINLDSIWSFTNNKIKFFEYTEKEINQFINN